MNSQKHANQGGDQQRHETKITVVVDRTSIITKAGEVARVVT